MKKATQEQIEGWKKQYGMVFQVTVDDKIAYLRKPDRQIIAYGLTKVSTDPLGFNEVILKNCWIAGDEEIKTNDDYFMAVSAQLEQIMEVKTADIKKL